MKNQIYYNICLLLYLFLGLLFAENQSEFNSSMDSLRQSITLYNNNALIKMNEIRTGTLVRKIEESNMYEVLPELKTNVSISVDGMVSTTIVDQVFTNPSTVPLEAIYVFPLPIGGAVNDMKMIVNDRFIQGIIKEKVEAKEIYEKAKKEGKRASLTEQSRPNIFTNSVANIMPGDTIIVRLSYVETLHYEDGKFSLRFPMVVGPRYIPGNKVIGYSGNGWALDTDIVPDASQITPPVIPPGMRSGNVISLSVNLNAGLPIENINCVSHKISKNKLNTGKYKITLSEDSVIPNKDFVLDYTIKSGDHPQAALFTSTKDGDDYFMLMTIPPVEVNKTKPIPKEIIFVVDVSGSMSGISIEQTRNSLELALTKLNPEDYFNIIAFQTNFSLFSSSSIPANDKNILQGTKFIRGLKAGGGTEAYPALTEAMRMKKQSETLKMIIFLTDGCLGNETEVFNAIDRHLGNSRIFSIGIGSAPNSYLLEKASKLGRGRFTYISSVSEVEKKMNNLFMKLEYPVLTDLDLYLDHPAELHPKPIPDLYIGEPFIVFGKTNKHTLKDATLIGKTSDGYFKTKLSVDLSQAQHNPAIPTLWARQKINGLMGDLRLGASDSKQKIIDLAIEHKIMSKFTSFVAVEHKMVNPDESPLKVAIPTNLPEGWDFEKVFSKTTQSMKAIPMPKTATNEPLWFLIGTLLLLISAVTKLSLVRLRK